MTPLDDIAILVASFTALGLGGFRFARWSQQHETAAREREYERVVECDAKAEEAKLRGEEAELRRRDPEARALWKAAIEEKRRLLERKRKDAFAQAGRFKTDHPSNRAWTCIASEAEKELLALAEEEARG